MRSLCGLNVGIDTREQDKIRIDAVRKYFTERGACVSFETLATCDYHITGYFGPDDDIQEVDIGIEMKTGTDFSGSFTELNDRFARASEQYEWVGLIVQHDHNSIIDDMTDTPTYIYQPKADLTLYTNFFSLQNTLQSYSAEGILVGQAWELYEVPRHMVRFLYYITAPAHKGICFNDKYDIRNSLLKVPGVGVRVADKLIGKFGTLAAICSASEKEIQAAIGEKTGARFFSFINMEGRRAIR